MYVKIYIYVNIEHFGVVKWMSDAFFFIFQVSSYDFIIVTTCICLYNVFIGSCQGYYG